MSANNNDDYLEGLFEDVIDKACAKAVEKLESKLARLKAMEKQVSELQLLVKQLGTAHADLSKLVNKAYGESQHRDSRRY